MPLFSRADRKPKPPGRFSFRKHEAPDARGSLSSSASSSGGAGRRKKPRDVVNPPPPAANPPLHAGKKSLSSSAVSASTASSSVSSSRLSASVRSSTSTARSTSPTIIESFSGDTDTGSDTEGARDSTDSRMTVGASNAGRPPTNASQPTARAVRNSLVDYRQLRCSMSYKNRIESQQRAGSSSSSALRSSEDRSRASTDESAYYVATTPSSTYSASSPAFARSSTRISEVVSEADRADDAPSRESRVSSRASVHRASVASSSRPRPSEDASAPERRSETPMTEANVAAMQTRRAFQQMVLAMKTSSSDDEFSDEDVSDDDLSSSEDEYSSKSKFPRASSMRTTVATSTATASARGGIVRLGADEYRKFQFRLRQLEDMCAEQAHKQAFMDEAIEREVAIRTRAVVSAMDKKIEMYRQAKALEVEREIARRVSEMDLGRGSSSRRSLMMSSSSRMSTFSTQSLNDSELKGKPLEKIFHPRRARARRVQRLQEIEEQQKREMEQFRAFIQSTESRGLVQSPETDVSNDAELSELLQRDPPPSVEELAELVIVLRQHVEIQEKQLGEAKKIINAAIDAREEAERMAEEAVALTMQLDSRLDRASQQMSWVRDELSQSMLLSPKEFTARASRVLSAPMFMTPPERAEDANEDKRASSRIPEES